jgi:uncharacterized protein YjbJ (UPF0337 family)
MSEEHIKGGIEKLGGRIKEATGALTGNEHLKSEGRLDQVKGGAHEAWGDVKDAAKDLGAKLRQTAVKSETAVNRRTVLERERDPLDPTELP